MDCLELLPTIEDGSIDIICIDPPYLYLKGQKLERPFDEQLFFSECKRVLTKDGFIVMFGRGESFYRWNYLLSQEGFNFKEEVVWDKNQSSSPLMAMSRVHETISIWTSGAGIINRVKVPYIEVKKHNIESLVSDIKRIRSAFGNPRSFEAIQVFLETNELVHTTDKPHKNNATVQESGLKTPNRCMAIVQAVRDGMTERTIIRTDKEARKEGKGVSVREGMTDGNRCVNVMQSMAYGLNEKTVIRETRDHYNTIHPTQKPVRLIERLLALVLPPNKPLDEILIADFFGGSFSTMEACYNMGVWGISCEIDEEYFTKGKARIDALPPTQFKLFDD